MQLTLRQATHVSVSISSVVVSVGLKWLAQRLWRAEMILPAWACDCEATVVASAPAVPIDSGCCGIAVGGCCTNDGCCCIAVGGCCTNGCCCCIAVVNCCTDGGCCCIAVGGCCTNGCCCIDAGNCCTNGGCCCYSRWGRLLHGRWRLLWQCWLLLKHRCGIWGHRCRRVKRIHVGVLVKDCPKSRKLLLVQVQLKLGLEHPIIVRLQSALAVTLP